MGLKGKVIHTFKQICIAVKNLTRLPIVSAAPAIIIMNLQQPSGDPYLDAGTGSIIIQALIGAFAGALLLLKIYWSKVKAFFKGLASGGKGRGDLQE
ncbi:MAG: hypothetical protein A2Y59_04080 [Chloroflexi bacterium RBG_13_52_14]|nr:MAG: hypothetical protein A2Y59_04080 [Chloroflexi bacterium RBG_13_52_14]